MNRTDDNIFVETLEYRRFAEFCDACRHCQYVGLCYRSPVVAKTLSARRYSLWDRSRRDVYKVSVLPTTRLTTAPDCWDYFRFAHAAGVSSAIRLTGKSLNPGRTEPR